MRCVACAGTLARDGHTADGMLVRCARCGTRGIELADVAAVPHAYGAAYRRGADTGKTARLVELFRAHVETSPATLLDVGCGDGAFLASMRAHGWIVHGLDLDPAAESAGRARGIPVTVAAAGSADAGEPFAAITLWDLIEHVPDPRATARWLAGRCRAGGVVVVLTPDAGSIFDRVAAWERSLTGGRSSRVEQLCLNRYHLHRFSAAGLEALFSSAGFRTLALRPLQLFSLRPEVYLSGFAPGIAGFSTNRWIDGWLSRVAHAAVSRLGVTNKLLYVGIREETSRHGGP